MELNFMLLFLDSVYLFIDSIPLQFDIFGGEQQALGSDDPIVKGVILSLFAVTGFGILLNVFNAAVRKKMIDQVKLKRIMKETRSLAKGANGCNEGQRPSQNCRTR